MSVLQTCCHVKAGRAKIPGISSQVSHLVCHRRDHSELKTLPLFLPCCSKAFLWKKKQKAICPALFFHPFGASSPGRHLPSLLFPSSCQAPLGAWVGAARCLPFLLPLALDQGAGLSLMKATHCICVSEQDLHQILGFQRWAQACTTSRWEEWDAGRVIVRAVWWATEVELLTPHPLPWQRPNLALSISHKELQKQTSFC